MNPSPATNLWLARFAKFVVAMTFVLIFVGGHTTTAGAGMAFPDWPLSHGSFYPAGWWGNFFERLEHGHRLIAGTVGLLVGGLMVWVLRSPASSRLHRSLALWAFGGVCLQAILGGLRVTIESGGDPATALVFRVLHGCLAQLELCLLVALASLLSPVLQSFQWRPAFSAVSKLSWICAVVVFVQLIVGAAMRHLGAGLAISTFPRATPGGAWLPASDTMITEVILNFAHTRVGALVVSGMIAVLVCRGVWGGERFIIRPALLLAFLVICQVGLGVSVILGSRPPLLTTLHVLNGAAVLATIVLLGVRTTQRLRGLQSERSTGVLL